MIFVCVGSREYKFDRLIRLVDDYLIKNNISSNVFMQIGTSDYVPQRAKYERFLSKEQFEYYLNESDIIITHGGVGVIVASLKQNKKVIVVPRYQKYKEHIDDHQLQISNVFNGRGFLFGVIHEGDDLETIMNSNKKITQFDLKSNFREVLFSYLEQKERK